MQTKLKQWLQEIKQQAESCQLQHIDLLLNTTDMQCDYFKKELVNLKPLPQVSWLFENTPEQKLAYNGPVLIRLQWTSENHQQWLETLLGLIYNDFRIILIASPWQFLELTTVLRHYSQARWMDGLYGGLFRYYEPRVLPIAYNILTNKQQAELQQAIIKWHYLDRDNQPQQLNGQYKDQQTIIPLTPLMLDDKQLNALYIWQAAESYRLYYMLQPEDYQLTSKQQLFDYLVEAQTQAHQQGKQQLEERDQFVSQWLAEHIQPTNRV